MVVRAASGEAVEVSAPAWPGYRLQVAPADGALSPALARCLARDGADYAIVSADEGGERPDALLYEHPGAAPPQDRGRVPVLAVVAAERLADGEAAPPAADFIVCPWAPGELAARVRRLLDAAAPQDAPGVIRSGDLVIDTNRYDVYLAGRPVLLTYKEYELLRVLASSPGRVYRRETLLEDVWGYAYFGGTRTVDVHVRRLRSKIEDAAHTFIDTVWNVGYRFRG